MPTAGLTHGDLPLLHLSYWPRLQPFFADACVSDAFTRPPGSGIDKRTKRSTKHPNCNPLCARYGIIKKPEFLVETAEAALKSPTARPSKALVCILCRTLRFCPQASSARFDIGSWDLEGTRAPSLPGPSRGGLRVPRSKSRMSKRAANKDVAPEVSRTSEPICTNPADATSRSGNETWKE